ncbi:MAG: hypothetical protein ACKOCM_06385 [Cyanobacteriota bacterium]
MSDPSPIAPVSSAGPQRPTLWQRLIDLLTVREDPDHRESPGRRLSSCGHAVLTGSLFLSASVAFLANMEYTRSIVHRWDLCIHTSAPNAAPTSTEVSYPNWQESQKILQQTINSLTVATPAQRSRLLEQHHEVQAVMNSYCLISHNFEIQFTSFTFVGTAAAILLTICLASVAPEGLKTEKRGLLNTIMSSSIILAVCVVYPQTFAQRNNQDQAKLIYSQAADQMRIINSTLANNQITTNPQSPNDFLPLDSKEAVATFIRMNDNALVQLTSARVSINNDFANRTFNRLGTDDNRPRAAGGSAATPAP